MVDQLIHRRHQKTDPLDRKPVFPHLAGNQIAPGDLPLFERSVTGQPDDLHPVPQRLRNGVKQIGGRDEEN